MQFSILKKTAAVLVAFGATAAFGAGFQLYTEGAAESLGQAGAISAREDMLSNAWYNPASLTEIETPRLMLGVTPVALTSTYSEGGYAEDMEDNVHLIPHAYFACKLNETHTFSLSVNAPYGLGTEWPKDWNGRADSVEMLFQSVYITPAMSWNVNDKLSLAAGASLAYADLLYRVDKGTGIIRHEADDEGLGYMLAAHYQANENWRLGATYHSQINFTLRGDAQDFPVMSPSAPPPTLVDSAVQGDLTLPETLTLGISNTSIENLTLGMDFVYTGWSSYDKLAITYTDIGYTANTPKEWKDVWSYRFGAEYQLNETWCVRAGYVYDVSPLDEYVGPELPGNDRQMFSIGCGYTHENIGVDAAYCYLAAEDVDARNTLPGRFSDSYTHLFSLSVQYDF